MRTTTRFLASALVAGALGLLIPALASARLGAAPDPKDLAGTWTVDLRPKPDAPAYTQPFVVREVEGSTFRGTFYGTEIEEARTNVDWGVLHFAFVTRDGTGAYNHSGALRDGKLEGLSHSLGRDFLAVWRAARAE